MFDKNIWKCETFRRLSALWDQMEKDENIKESTSSVAIRKFKHVKFLLVMNTADNQNFS